MTLIDERPVTLTESRPNPSALWFVAGILLAGLIAAAAVLFIAHHSTAGKGQPETLTFQQDGSSSSGGPVAVPDCATLVGQRITSLAVAVGCTVNGASVNIPWSTCSDKAHWYSIPDGANVVYGKGGGDWKIADQATYLTDAAQNC